MDQPSRMASLLPRLAALLPPGTWFSPYSLQLALALVGAGANGRTLSELQEAMGWPTGEGWQHQLAQIVSNVQTELASGEPLLLMANRVYVRVSVRREYAQAVRDAFSAELAPLTSAATINNFVSETTNHVITEIVNEQAVQQSDFIALNAIYFKGKFAVPFDKTLTATSPFANSGNCNLMQSGDETEWKYYEDAAAQYVLLPYQGTAGGSGSSLAAVVVLQRNPSANPLEGVHLDSLNTKFRFRKGKLWIPRFRGESNTELKQTVQQLGVRQAFEAGADFSGVSSDPLIIAGIIQKVIVEVNEEGTIAAGATAVCGFAGPPPDPGFKMRCDRPFGFLVVNQITGLALFAGTVINPGLVGDLPPAQDAGQVSPPPVTAAASSWSFFSPVAADLKDKGISQLEPTSALSAAHLTAEQRREQLVLFTPACRRDAYRVLCSEPRRPLVSPSQKQSAQQGAFSDAFGQQQANQPFLSHKRISHAPLKWVLSLADGTGKVRFVRPGDVHLSDYGVVEAIQRTLKALEQLGVATSEGIAVTEAFESLLITEYVDYLTDDCAATLSAAFLVAFGHELTPRLDISHAIRTRPFNLADLEWLNALPPCIQFDRSLLVVFQGFPKAA